MNAHPDLDVLVQVAEAIAARRRVLALASTIIARLAAPVAVRFPQPGGYDAGTGGRHASCL